MNVPAKIVILITILFLPFLVKGQQQDGSVFERRVNVRYENQQLEHILEQLSWQAGVFFSYDASIIDPERRININVQNKSLYTVLNQLFDSKKFNLQERENQIIITRNNGVDQTSVVIDTVPVHYFFLRGKVVEERRERPVEYASVSVLGKPIGTISNTDGDFLLKLHPDMIRDTVVISCMGYSPLKLPAHKILDEDLFILNEVSIRIKEVKVTAISTDQLLNQIHKNLEKNYSNQNRLMTAFYRETIQQDKSYINVSEAVIEILKSSYSNSARTDLVRILKGRKSPDVQPLRWLNFKLQGGPFTINQLDVVKNMESFLDNEYRTQYEYEIKKVIWYNEEPVYVVGFSPVFDFFPGFSGEMYVHRESYAVVHANFRFSKYSLKEATDLMIRKKPRGVKARPSYVEYQVNYQKYQGKWHLSTVRSSVKFRIRSTRNKLNSEFHSISDLLITNIQPTELRRFPSEERFRQNDVFVEQLGKFDEKFWENYNIIKPDEDLRKAFKNP